ncbi:LysR family transcriptional regulator [uncultured Endozoicomonas sp.]|uniref:LysR family transcriptional regulator n=1 Tax=uncultured Endozoicomonas sp. TaxID=432652 RepID=UPI002624E937|nr:LysR family transcriptional regulator [uncultured Endozoicomonas sp.]
MKNLNWDDIRIALTVADTGSLSAAGQQLEMTHSTVLRRVKQLENQLGQRLFIRHQRGYRLTEVGHQLLEKGKSVAADMQLLQSSLTMMGDSPSGTLRISTVSDFSQFLVPLVAEFQQQYPSIQIEVVATDEILTLNRGDIHAALRVGSSLTEPDLIAKPLMQVTLSYFASGCYAERFGLPQTLDEVTQHRWVLPAGGKQRIPGIKALYDRLEPENIVFKSNSFHDIYFAVLHGMGIGPFESLNRQSQAQGPIHQVDFGLATEASPMWMVYHKDLKDSIRIKLFQDYLMKALPAFISY